VGFNKVFGYYIEVTRSNLERVPAHYERRQTIANAERFVTRELKELEASILNAEDLIGETEARLFVEVRAKVAAQVGRMQSTADLVAELDVLGAFAQCADRRGYVRPEVHGGFALEIRGGRHPVVETMMPREKFIPNDVVLDDGGRIVILTSRRRARSCRRRMRAFRCATASSRAWVHPTISCAASPRSWSRCRKRLRF
jgi:DNA mismatch repair protein MutS